VQDQLTRREQCWSNQITFSVRAKLSVWQPIVEHQHVCYNQRHIEWYLVVARPHTRGQQQHGAPELMERPHVGLLGQLANLDELVFAACRFSTWAL
jgi:hypothetical protein